MTTASSRPPGTGIALWALAGFVLYLVGGLVMLFASLMLAEAVLGMLRIDWSSGTIGLSIRNATHPIGWAGFVVAVAIPLGARLVPGLRFGARSWIALVAGIALATVTTFLDIEFVRASHGVYDFEYGGWTGLAGPALVAIALAGWAALAIPSASSRVLDGLTIAAGVGLIALLLPSVAGALDGIDPANIPIAIAFIADAIYAAVVAALVGRDRPQPT